MDKEGIVKSHIDQRPSWLVDIAISGLNVGVVGVDGEEYAYTIVESTKMPNTILYGVGFPDGDISKLFIANNVPKLSVDLYLRHEIREFRQLSELPQEERCLASLKIELAEAKEQLSEAEMREYKIGRRACFSSLVYEHYATEESRVGLKPGQHQAMTNSIRYLKSLD